MFALVPMKEGDFPAFFEAAVESYTKNNVAGGRWNAADAPALAREETQRLLPQNERTADNRLFVLEDKDREAEVGYLWFGTMTRGTKKVAYLYQLHVHAQFRRKGYGHQAMRAFEREAHASGHDALALTVFAANSGAHRLYESVGYRASSIVMRKELRPRESSPGESHP